IEKQKDRQSWTSEPTKVADMWVVLASGTAIDPASSNPKSPPDRSVSQKAFSPECFGAVRISALACLGEPGWQETNAALLDGDSARRATRQDSAWKRGLPHVA